MADRPVYMLVFLLGFIASCDGVAVPRTTRVGIQRTKLQATHPALRCRDGAVEHNGTCYKLYTDAKTFEDASATCTAAPGGGHLITIDSAEVQEFVKSQMELGNVGELWMGAKREISDWHWVEANSVLKYQGCFSDRDDTRLDVYIGSSPNYTPDSCITQCRSNNMKYAGVKRDSNDGTKVVCRCGNSYKPYKYLVKPGCNYVCPADSDQKCGNIEIMRIYAVENAGVNGWYKDQPNDYQSYQGCLAMHEWDGSYKWGDEQCHGAMNSYGYLCQYDADELRCSHRYDAGKCFSEHPSLSSRLSWYQARYLCKKDGGDLLQIDTKEIFNFLQSAQLDSAVHRWWIGGERERWQMVDGEDMIFTNWAMDRPESESKACAVVGRDVGQSYEWEDRSCSDTAAFICLQKELMTTTTTSTAASTTAEPSTTTKTATTTMVTTQVATRDIATTKITTTKVASPNIATTSTESNVETTSFPATTVVVTIKTPTTSKTPTTTTTAKETTPSATEMSVTVSLATAVADKSTAKSTVFTTGVVLAIIVAVLFVVLAFVRLIAYCGV